MTTNELETYELDVSTLPNGTDIEDGDQFTEASSNDVTWTVIDRSDQIEAQGMTMPCVWLESRGDNRWIEHGEFARLLDADEFTPIDEGHQ